MLQLCCKNLQSAGKSAISCRNLSSWLVCLLHVNSSFPGNSAIWWQIFPATKTATLVNALKDHKFTKYFHTSRIKKVQKNFFKTFRITLQKIFLRWLYCHKIKSYDTEYFFSDFYEKCKKMTTIARVQREEKNFSSRFRP